MSRRHRRSAALLSGLFTAGIVAVAPASALAATVTVTGDSGSPVEIPLGGSVAIRNMSPSVGIAFPPGGGRFKMVVTDAAGNQAAFPADCFSKTTDIGPTRVKYAGNQTYTVTVTNYAADDYGCATPVGAPEAYRFAIDASVAVTPPGGAFAFRNAGSFETFPYVVTVQGNPGADADEVQYALNGRPGPDGALVPPFAKATTDAAGQAKLYSLKAGAYTIVARAISYSSATDVGSPWSAPVRLIVKAPFDFSGGGVDFTDRRGPTYGVRATLRDPGATGKVSVSLARGRTGGVYRSIGSARIARKGTISKRFVARRTGAYRLRFTFKGSAFGQAGRVTVPIRVTRGFF